MLHNIYIVVDDGLVSQVFINNSNFQKSDMSVCVINVGDDSTQDAAVRDYVCNQVVTSQDLTEVLPEFPNYDDIEEGFNHVISEEI